jgi:hypothetical protein
LTNQKIFVTVKYIDTLQEVTIMRRDFRRSYLKVGSFLAALGFSCSSSNAAQAVPTVIYKSSSSGTGKILSMSLPVAILLLTSGGFALNEYYGSQGHPWTHPLWANKGIKAINKNGISKNEIKDEDENSRILAFFGKSAETLENNIDILEAYKDKNIKEIFSKLKPQFTVDTSVEREKNKDLCVIARNLTSGKNYVGVPGSYPYSNLVEMWKTICNEEDKIGSFYDNKKINENKLHPIFNFIYELKRNFGATNFGNAKIKFLFHSFKDEKVGNAKSVVSSVVITKNNKEKNGILEIRLDFAKLNSDKPVSVSFYSPCSWEKEPVIVPIVEKPIENSKPEAKKNEEKKLDGKKKGGLLGWGWTIGGYGI